MRATARLYLAGNIDQWYFKTDESGIVLIMHVSNSGEGRELLSKLLLGRAGLMEFEFIPSARSIHSTCYWASRESSRLIIM